MRPAEKSAITRWVEKVTGKDLAKVAHVSRQTVEGGVSSIVQGGEALVVGGGLGALHAELKTGLDVGKVPIDGVVAAVGLLGSVAAANHPLADNARRIGANALAVYSFRNVGKLIKAIDNKKGGFSTAKVHGEDDDDMGDEDPIVALARTM
jgi:hypothetical protein